ncbi:MAG: Tim44-like domain-containing protein [Bacteroidota bacterium]
MNFILKLFLFIFLISSSQAFSRAGGGGGKSSSSSSSSSSSHSSSSSSHHSSGSVKQAPKWVVVIVIGIIISFVLFLIIGIAKSVIFSKKHPGISEHTSVKKNQSPVITNEFTKANTGFSKEDFKLKAKTAFMAIQKAWEEKDLSNVRNWISDGVYQRFCLQFDMMNQLGQKNLLSKISINKIEFIKASIEGSYSIITVSIDFRMNDRFISEKLPDLNEEYIAEDAIEYWTFIKKSGAIDKNLYTTNSCPNCGDELNKDGGEVSKCPSCSTITYLGDYDWVLSEITQEEDYEDDLDYDANDKGLTPLRNDEDFCIQTMEDKAANAFIHYLFASAWNKADCFNRFGTDEVMKELKKEIDEPYIYNRIYINRVTFSECTLADQIYHMNFTVVYTAQRVRLVNNKVKKLDDDMEMQFGDITLSRKAQKANTKSKLWSYECSNCGAPYDDSISTTCNYCHNKINTAEHDWIVTSICKA